MNRFFLVLALSLIGAVGLLGASRDTSAGGYVPAWPSLSETCHDVTGDGHVDLPNDILGVILRYGTVYGGPPNPNSGLEYALLYDVKGPNAPGGTIDLPNDILSVIQAYGTTCSLIDTQVVAGTVVAMQYQDCQAALADGYIQSTQMVPNMGIHLAKTSNVTNYPNFFSGDINDPDDQLRHPAGLICTDSNPDPNVDVPDKLIGMWYVMPNMEVCSFYGSPPTCDDAEPVGFGSTNTDEDNIDYPNGGPDSSVPQKAWHTHPGLCVWGVGTAQAGSGENFTQSGCDAQPQPSFWFSEYGWMAHLYNFIPNQDGRFLMWSLNVPFAD